MKDPEMTNVMTRMTKSLAALIVGGLLLAPASGYAQQENLSRQERLRQHEERVKQIIEERKARRREMVQKSEDEIRQEYQEEGGAEATETAAPEATPAPYGTVILYIGFHTSDTEEMTLDTVLNKGQRFVSEVRLQNEASTGFDRLRIALKYDKRFLRPLKVIDDEVRPYVKRTPKFERLGRESMLVYDAELESPRYNKDLAVLKIVWEALLPTEYTGLGFEFASGDTELGYHTAVYQDGNNILGQEEDPFDGVLGGSIMIMRPRPSDLTKPVLLQGKKEELITEYMNGVGEQPPVGMQLAGPAYAPAVGQEFDVDVMLNNPGGAVVDALKFRLAFDPEVLEVVDNDKGNWIKRGINTHDGPFRRDYPWDFHKRNEADNVRGRVNYSMALGEAQALPSGAFTRVRFRALSPTAGTSIEIVPSQRGLGQLTSVQCFGFDLIPEEGGLANGIIELPVLPEGEGEAVLAKGNRVVQEPEYVPPYVYDWQLSPSMDSSSSNETVSQ